MEKVSTYENMAGGWVAGGIAGEEHTLGSNRAEKGYGRSPFVEKLSFHVYFKGPFGIPETKVKWTRGR